MSNNITNSQIESIMDSIIEDNKLFNVHATLEGFESIILPILKNTTNENIDLSPWFNFTKSWTRGIDVYSINSKGESVLEFTVPPLVGTIESIPSSDAESSAYELVNNAIATGKYLPGGATKNLMKKLSDKVSIALDQRIDNIEQWRIIYKRYDIKHPEINPSDDVVSTINKTKTKMIGYEDV